MLPNHLLGTITKKDIRTSLGLLLVPAGTMLEQKHLNLVLQHRVDLSEIEQMTDDSSPEQGSEPSYPQAELQQAVGQMKELFEEMKRNQRVPVMKIKNELLPIVQQVSEYPDLYDLIEFVKAKDQSLYQHNIGVSVIATLIGRWMGQSAEELSTLSLAALMHDVGKVFIPDELLHKPGPLTAEEQNEMKRHPMFGYGLLKRTAGLDPRVSLVALQHHERMDGSGYPLALPADRIEPFSKIVAVANVFHAMSSGRPQQPPMPYYQVVAQMRDGFFGALDPSIVSVFLDHLSRHLIGRRVKLTDGQWGKVVYNNPYDPLNPMVEVNDAFINLSDRPDLHISEVVV